MQTAMEPISRAVTTAFAVCTPCASVVRQSQIRHPTLWPALPTRPEERRKTSMYRVCACVCACPNPPPRRIRLCSCPVLAKEAKPSSVHPLGLCEPEQRSFLAVSTTAFNREQANPTFLQVCRFSCTVEFIFVPYTRCTTQFDGAIKRKVLSSRR